MVSALDSVSWANAAYVALCMRYQPQMTGGANKRGKIMENRKQTNPATIFLQNYGDSLEAPTADKTIGGTWCKDSFFESDVPYIRADIAERQYQELRHSLVTILELLEAERKKIGSYAEAVLEGRI